jgi:hypothetical protein
VRISGKDLAIRLNGLNGQPGSTPTWIEVTVIDIWWFCCLNFRAMDEHDLVFLNNNDFGLSPFYDTSILVIRSFPHIFPSNAL